MTKQRNYYQFGSLTLQYQKIGFNPKHMLSYNNFCHSKIRKLLNYLALKINLMWKLTMLSLDLKITLIMTNFLIL